MIPVCTVIVWRTHIKFEVIFFSLLSKKKRKRKGAESKCNGTGSQKRHRESVLRLNGEGPAATHVCLQGSGQDEREERPTPTSIFLVKNGGGIASIQMCDEESGEDIDLQNLDHSIVKFTVGADDPADVLVPILAPNLGAPDFTNTLRQRLLPVSDNTTKTSPSEPSEYKNNECVAGELAFLKCFICML